MIAFSSLFLGLVLGLQPVELLVGGEVAAVELRLDGAAAGRVTGPPWSAELDFGDELLPRRLEAVALDAGGGEIARTLQWINLPQDPAVTRWVLDGGDGEGRVARLTWESYAGADPLALRVTFDGMPLAVEDPGHVELPPHDLAQLHFLRAELDFEDNVTSVAEMTFGGTYADRVSTELTAVAIAGERRKAPRLEELRGLFVEAGEPLEVVAVDRGVAEVVMVVDRDFPAVMVGLLRREVQRRRVGRFGRIPAGPLKRDQRLRFLYPVPEDKRGARRSFKLFPQGPEYAWQDGDVFALLTSFQPLDGEQRLADAVAVAGLTASGHRRRRVVVLALGPAPADGSRLDPGRVRRYLAALNVPLAVWYPGAEVPPAVEPWGDPADVSTFARLDGAFSDVKRLLDRQWIVWLDGTHLPQDVELDPRAEGLRIVR